MTLESVRDYPTKHAAVLVDHCPRCGANLLRCAVPGCSRDSRARGLCKAHYARLMRLGTVAADVPVRERVAS